MKYTRNIGAYESGEYLGGFLEKIFKKRSLLQKMAINMRQLQNAHTTQWVICKKAITTKTPLPYFLTVTEKKIHTYLLPLYSPVSCLLLLPTFTAF